MAFNSIKPAVLLLLGIAMATSKMALGSDPDILSDFINPNSNNVDGKYFTFTETRGIFNTFTEAFKVTKASMECFQLSLGRVSFAVLQYPAGTVNPPHTHPRSAELLFVIDGSLKVGFVDTKNVLHTRELQVADMFIFPKGLVHYQYNAYPKNLATALSAFGSANAGTVSVPLSVFTTGINEGILAKAFKTDIATIKKIKAGFGKP